MVSDIALLRARNSKRYKVNLAEQLACCEANYARMLKLLPNRNNQDEWRYQVQSGGKVWQIRLHITERARYTTMLQIYQDDGQRTCVGSAVMEVRLYHDAQMAEVVAWYQHRQLKPRYDYPNDKMYQQDEKAQLNRFLSDWLIHNQAHGYAKDAVGL